MSEGKEGFVLYKGFWAPIEALDNEALGRLFRAIYEYQTKGTTDCDPDIKMAFMFFLNQFRVDEKKYLKIVERNRLNGEKGGRPRKNPEKPKEPSGLIGNPKNPSEPRKADKDKDKEKDKDIGKEKGKRFTPPTIEEVKNYCLERKNSVDAIKWHDHYTSNGWMVGKNRMKDWKAAVRTWEKNEFNDGRNDNGKRQQEVKFLN